MGSNREDSTRKEQALSKDADFLRRAESRVDEAGQHSKGRGEERDANVGLADGVRRWHSELRARALLGSEKVKGPIAIRRTDDLDEVKALNAQCFRTDEPPNFERARWWLAWRGDEPVGFGGIRQVNPTIAFLERAGVLPAFRGRGVQLQLIRVRLRWAVGMDVITYTLPNNTASSNNLIRAGFVMFEPDWAWVGRKNVLYWIKPRAK